MTMILAINNKPSAGGFKKPPKINGYWDANKSSEARWPTLHCLAQEIEKGADSVEGVEATLWQLNVIPIPNTGEQWI
ncbi:hypothetical protein GOP47_0007663 [Adiantum capillus-veneris]|uniref:Uncharacterized protein n=1 Tax=Adiantum capillus-veneris TaxID=13818 RepID=A0A9D4V1G6_ADICA|nr:hypothetical protein GOP47_0007663 [Adiantum capillus-veneris]